MNFPHAEELITMSLCQITEKRISFVNAGICLYKLFHNLTVCVGSFLYGDFQV